MSWHSTRFNSIRGPHSRSNLKLRSVDPFFALSLDPLWIASLDGRFRRVNPALLRALGHSETYLLSVPILDLVHPADRVTASAALESVAAGRRNAGLRTRFLCADGSHKPFHWRSVPASGLAFAVAHDLSRRELQDQALLQSDALCACAFESTTDAFFAVNYGWRLIRVNRKAATVWMRDRKALLGRHLWEVFPEAMGGPLHRVYDQVMRTGVPAELEEFFPYAPHKGWFQVHVCRSPEGLAVYFRDVTARRQAEERVRQTFEEKEVLLREVHHRVKNNLQVICSMLRLQERNSHDQTLLQALRDCRERVMAMAMLHDQLHRAKDFANICLGGYIRNLAASLFCSYGVNSADVALSLDVEDVPVLVDTAIPCGLIVNELLSNSLRHAFPEGAQGHVSVGLHAQPGGLVELTIGDDGRGFAGGVRTARPHSLGLWLVELLAAQIGAAVQRSSGPGTHYRLTFQGASPSFE